MTPLSLDPFDLPLAASALDGLYHVVLQLSALFAPWAGASAAAAAIVALTLGVRLVLLPVSVAQVRAELGRRRIAPQVAALRSRHAKNTTVMTQKLRELYTAEKVSPFAGILPTLLQLPVLSGFYALFSHVTIAGHANLLLTHVLAGAVLGSNLFGVAAAGLPALVAPLVVLLLLAVVVEVTRRANARWAVPADPAAPTVPGMATMTRILPFLTVVFAGVAPLAAALYLLTSAAWTAVERPLLRKRLARA